MSQQVQELIDKIKAEGVQAASENAREIVHKARANSQAIVTGAEEQAKQLVADAKAEIKKIQESAHMALVQASRDTILSLRKEIENILVKIARNDVGDALTPQHLSTILTSVIEKYLVDNKSEANIEVALSPKDLASLKDSCLAKLQGRLKESFKVQASDEIAKGFTISFDNGKSSFDFTDESLAEFLSCYLNSQVSDIVKEAVSS